MTQLCCSRPQRKTSAKEGKILFTHSGENFPRLDLHTYISKYGSRRIKISGGNYVSSLYLDCWGRNSVSENQKCFWCLLLWFCTVYIHFGQSHVYMYNELSFFQFCTCWQKISGSSLLSCYHDKLCTCASYWTQCSWSCPPWPSCCPWWPAPGFEGCENSSVDLPGTAGVHTQPVPLLRLQVWLRLPPPQELLVVVLPATPPCLPYQRFATWL